MVVAVLVVAGVVMIQEGQRRIPVQYAKRVVGRKMYGGQSTHIPMKVNQSGVIPIIFALSLLQFPLTITYFFPNTGVYRMGDQMAFTCRKSGSVDLWSFKCDTHHSRSHTSIPRVTFNPKDVADNMKANGGFIPGIRPGKATDDYLQKVMSRITIVGAIFLAIIATMPTIISSADFTEHTVRRNITAHRRRRSSGDGETALDNQMLMRNYQGFLK